MSLKLVYLGDIVGRPGRTILKESIPSLKDQYSYDLLIVNAENSAGGRGITPKIADELYGYGVNFITLGDHVWDEKDIIPYLEKHPDKIIRPANITAKDAGQGYSVIDYQGVKIGVFNLLGRVFMSGLYDCPFKAAENILENELKDCPVKILDLHAEATSEKYAMLRYLEGKVSLIVGTHTHVPTADQHISKDTGFVCDLGCTGSYNSVIGMDSELALQRFIGIPKPFKVASGDEKIAGIFAEIDLDNGKCLKLAGFHKKVRKF